MRWLNNIATITWRELSGFFLSPVAYIVMFLFVLANGILFYVDCLNLEGHPQQITRIIQSRFSFAVFLAIPISPLLTMRQLAEERRSGSIEMLMTVPVTESQVVIGKFLGAQIFYMVIWSTLLLFVAVLQALASPTGPDWGPVWAVYLGLVFLGAITNSLGLLASALSRNQLVAAVLSLVGTLAFFFVHTLVYAFPDPGQLTPVFEYFSVNFHFSLNYANGIIDLRYFGYCLSWALFFLFFSVRTVEASKWR
ncbi:MAG: ABC transporter permease [Planctomycetota bacterium]